MLQPSEFDSIKVGPPSRPSIATFSKQPSASIIGIGILRTLLLLLVAGFSGCHARA
jgi:hypothetical protein